MQLAKIRLMNGRQTPAIVDGESVIPLVASDVYPTLADLMEAPDPARLARSLADGSGVQPLARTRLLAPID